MGYTKTWFLYCFMVLKGGILSYITKKLVDVSWKELELSIPLRVKTGGKSFQIIIQNWRHVLAIDMYSL